MKEWILGVDIGGSHISGAPVNLRAKKIDETKFERAEVDAWGSKSQIVANWVNLLNRFPLSDYSGIGIAMPAPFDYENGIAYLRDQGKFSSLYGTNIKQLLAKELGFSSNLFTFSNDAASFLQGEVDYGDLNENTRLMGITLGTGLGTAFKLDAYAKDAELWSSPFKDGIAEDYLGTNWFNSWARTHHGLEVFGLKSLLEIADRTIVEEASKKFGYNLGEFLVPQLQEKGIEMLIVGGNIAKAADLFLPWTKKFLADANLTIDMHISSLGEFASKYGAASIRGKLAE